MPTFEQKKKNFLIKIDKSFKQSIDKKILKLCEKINRKKEYFTTSSCSGRIVLILGKEKKEHGLFLFTKHEKIIFRELSKELEKAKNKTKKLIYFKMEPVILHIACKDLLSANLLLKKAQKAGWKRSGIISLKEKQIIELMSTEKLELPIIFKGKILVSNEYLKILIKEANKKLEKTHKRIKDLEKTI